MSIFGRIKSAIFGGPAMAADAGASPSTSTTTPPLTSAAPATPAAASPTAAPAASTVNATAQSATATVDVVPILDAAVKKSGQKLDWRHSIVDLMKALGMEASLDERRQLATELNYTGDTHDSAKMNMWLHKALLKKLSENGGKVPQELLD